MQPLAEEVWEQHAQQNRAHALGNVSGNVSGSDLDLAADTTLTAIEIARKTVSKESRAINKTHT